MTDLLPHLAPVSLPSPAPDNPEEALSWLGSTVEEVAEGLRARGIKGRQNESFSCPLSRYLRQHGFRRSIDYNSTRQEFVLGNERLTGLPHLVWFAKKFDSGAFPDLIDT